LQALHGQRQDAIQTLRSWANQDSIPAQRELGIALASQIKTASEAVMWLEKPH